jgi:hypothetical protein
MQIQILELENRKGNKKKERKEENSLGPSSLLPAQLGSPFGLI